MLTTEQIATITKELLLKRPPTIDTSEANAFREELKVELAEMRAEGVVPDLVSDFD